MAAITTLQLFDCYLPETENWAYRMLKNIPDTAIAVAAIRFNGKFQDTAFTFHRFPINPASYAETPLGKALIPGLIKPLYPLYLANHMPPPDIIHAHFANTGYFFLKLKKRFKRPFVISLYGFDYGALPASDSRWRARYRELFHETDLFLCEGPAGAELLRSQGCPAEKIGIARLGVDVQRIPFFERVKPSGQLRLLQVAALKKKKGQCSTVHAFADALKSCPDMHLTFVGKDSGDGTKEKVLAIINAAGIQEKITMTDAVAFENLHVFMRDFDVFIHPSCFTAHQDCEGGAPVVLLDAQATGLPVIATRHCDIPDEVLHGETGLLAPEKDVAALSEYIKIFYRMDAATYTRFSRQARAHVQRAYDARACGARLRERYEKLLQ